MLHIGTMKKASRHPQGSDREIRDHVQQEIEKRIPDIIEKKMVKIKTDISNERQKSLKQISEEIREQVIKQVQLEIQNLVYNLDPLTRDMLTKILETTISQPKMKSLVDYAVDQIWNEVRVLEKEVKENKIEIKKLQMQMTEKDQEHKAELANIRAEMRTEIQNLKISGPYRKIPHNHYLITEE